MARIREIGTFSVSDPLPRSASPTGRSLKYCPPCKGGRPRRRARPIGRSIKRSGRGSLTSPALACLVHALNARDDAGAVGKLVALDAGLLQQRQVKIRDRRALRQQDMLATDLHSSI